MYYNVPRLSRLLSDSRHDAGLLLLELSSRITTLPLNTASCRNIQSLPLKLKWSEIFRNISTVYHRYFPIDAHAAGASYLRPADLNIKLPEHILTTAELIPTQG